MSMRKKCSWASCCCVLVFIGLTPAHSLAQEIPPKGAKLLDPKDYEKLPVAPIPTSGNIPDSATLEQYFPGAGDQGSGQFSQSCAAWSSSYIKAYRIYRAYRDRSSVDNSLTPQDFLQSPAFLYSALTKEHCLTGLYVTEVLDFLHNTGSVFWPDLPYTDKGCPPWKQLESRAQNKSIRYKSINHNREYVIADIKNFIAHGDPVLLTIYACSELNSPVPIVITEAIGENTDKKNCGGHAIIAVGYDDRLQAIRLLNSWGTGWGDQGKVWVNYEVLMHRFMEGYVDFGPEALDVSLPHTVGVSSVLTPEVLARSLRANISPEELLKIKVNGETESVHSWAIWLNLPEQFQDKIASVDYYFIHPSFKNPKHSEQRSNIFLAQWKGYGCVQTAYLIAKTKTGERVRADFDFCQLVNHRAVQ